jgi:hypothetical protein
VPKASRRLKAGTTITPTPTQSGSKTLRTLLSYAALKKLKLSGADIVTAYLNGTLEEQIHMRQPPGLEEAGPKGEPMVCLLIKSIYGLKQSGACWEARLTAELKSIGFSRCETDPCLYRMEKGKEVIFLASYVDDLVLAPHPMICVKRWSRHLKMFSRLKTLAISLGSSALQFTRTSTKTRSHSASHCTSRI